jgi:hypothetical protein
MRRKTMRKSILTRCPVLLLGLALSAAPALGAAQDAPQRFMLNFSDAYLVYVPANGNFQIAAVGNVLSYGENWEVAKLRPYLFHVRLKTWKEFFWKVNTSRKEVYEVTGGTYGELGGTEKLKDYAMEVVGGAGDSVPERFQIKFPKAYLIHVPAKNEIQIIAGGTVLSYGEDWQAAQLKPYLYHFRQKMWKGFFWKVNSSQKKVWTVTAATFGHLGGTDKELAIDISVVQ